MQKRKSDAAGVSIVLALLFSALPVESSDLRQLALQQALTESVALGPEQQAQLLLRLFSVAKAYTPEVRLSLIQRLETSAQGVSEECAKASLLSGAARALASVEPNAAIARMSSYRGSCPSYWADAAVQVFPAIIEKCPECTEEISQAANSLGSLGQYPYRGVAQAVNTLEERQPEAATRLLVAAIGAYADNDTKSWNQHQQFIELVERSFQLIPSTTARQAFDSAFHKIKNAKEELQNSQSTMFSKEGPLQFTDKDKTISALLHLARRFDAAEKVQHQFPSFVEIPKDLNIIGGIQSASPKKTPKFINLIQELNRARSSVTTETTAMQIESASTTPFIKAGLFAVRGGLTSGEDDSTSKDFFAKSLKLISDLQDPTERVIALSAYLEAAEKKKDNDKLAWAVEHMFSLADSEYSKMDPKPPKMVDNYIFAILSRTIIRSRDNNQTFLFDAIEKLNEPELRAFLYAEVAYRMDN